MTAPPLVGCVVWSRFLIVCHAFRLLPVRSVDVIISSHPLLFSAAILLISLLPVSGSFYQKGCSCTTCMPHIGSLILHIDQDCSGLYTPLVYVSSMSHVWLRQNKDINVCCISTPFFLPHVKLSSRCSRGDTSTGFTVTQMGRCLVLWIGFRKTSHTCYQCWQMQR